MRHAAVSEQSWASAANPPSVDGFTCGAALWPSATLGWWTSWCFTPVDKSLHCPYLLRQEDTPCAWSEGSACVWSSWDLLLLVTEVPLLLSSCLVPTRHKFASLGLDACDLAVQLPRLLPLENFDRDASCFMEGWSRVSLFSGIH